MIFEFATATRIVFGPGSVQEAITAASAFGSRAMIVTGSNRSRADSFLGALKRQGIDCTVFSVSGEPTIPGIQEGIREAKESRRELIIGFGGGGALDAAKAIAALMTNPGNPLDYLEVVGSGKSLTRPCAPCICIPTTAGTGCEVTRNAVLLSPEHRVKVSLRSPRMLPVLAVVDPQLTYTLPPAATAATGMDALAQLIEPFVCNRANPMTDALCRDGIRRVALWLREAWRDGLHAEARENMALASLFGGLALANAGLGAVHGLAAPLGGAFPIPHGIVSAIFLPIVMEANVKALKARAPNSPAILRYREVAGLLTGNSDAESRDGADWVRNLCSELSIPRLSGFGITAADIPAVAIQAKRSSSMRGNPIELTREELEEILAAAL